MQCKVLLFSHLADMVGTSRMLLELPEGTTINGALDVICAQYPIVTSHRSAIATAIDEAYCSRSAPLHNGCTLALIPPVSGG
jgi:molybdopterin converting factor small subunit